ncbi:hypothetical protein [Campylobacter curvus]|uniref:Uncharacterized protein n=1 Tax=Campylobacter curvus (strain 525.92) TaxID=360105 RepID=A7H0U2_CAMC5|nr:hypothetical protein [Campylobacter curvus]EAU00322.1 hypothetical protein CCV52592_0031 [Campylobacter curvus 525.92]
MNFWDGLKNFGNNTLGWLGGSDRSGTPNWLMAAGIAGSLYGGYQQEKMAKKQFDLQKDAYDFNKMLSQREIDRQNQANQNLANAWTNSSFYKRKDDEDGY